MNKIDNYKKALEWLEVEPDGSVYRKERSWVSGKGTVRNQPRQLAKTYLMKKGYLRTNVWIDGKQYKLFIHRLVAEAFLQKPDGWTDDCEVNHINGVKTDNRVENLEWCTHSENIQHAWRTGLAKPNSGSYPKRAVEQICLTTGEVLKTYVSTHEAERETGFNQSNISACCLGKYKTAYGFGWRYSA